MGLAKEYRDEPSGSSAERVVAYLQRNWNAYLLIAPAALFLLSVVGYPILETFRLSLYDSPADTNVETFIGFDHYADIVNSDVFFQLL